MSEVKFPEKGGHKYVVKTVKIGDYQTIESVQNELLNQIEMQNSQYNKDHKIVPSIHHVQRSKNGDSYHIVMDRELTGSCQ